MLDVGQPVGKLRSDLKSRTDVLSATRAELVEVLAERVLEHHPATGGVTRVVVIRERDDLPMLRTLAGRLAARGDVVAFCASPDEGAQGDWSVVVQRGKKADFDCGQWLKAMTAAHGGRGGGRPERAEGRLPRAVSIVEITR